MKNYRVTLSMSRSQAVHLMRALEVFARAGMGQWVSIFELVSGRFDWDEFQGLERAVKENLAPELSPSAYYGIAHNKVQEEAKIAWDAYQWLRREISWTDKSLDWRKDKRDWGKMMGVNYDEPMDVAKEQGFNTVVEDR